VIVRERHEERQQIRELTREFGERELRPHLEAWDRDRTLGAGVLAQLAELGFFGLLLSEAEGGMGFDLPTYVAALEELAWGEPALALTVSIHNACVLGPIQRHGSAAQKERWLAPLAAGEVLGCFALSEDEAGSDAAAVTTRARRDGADWVLDGTKRWVTNGGAAGLALVLARTDADEGGAPGSRPGHGLFLVPTDGEGYRLEAREETLGLRALEVVTVRLDGVRLDADALLGSADGGLRLALEALDTGRLGIAAQAVGIGQAALEHAHRYADEREQFGQKIREFEAIQFKLADMATRVQAARSLVAWAAEQPSVEAAAMAKLFASEAAMAVATQAVQIFGGYGYMRDYPVEKLMRDAKATEIYEGTNEIQRVVIARGLYRS
jgi:butyryl-CoA dehydrogenase